MADQLLSVPGRQDILHFRGMDFLVVDTVYQRNTDGSRGALFDLTGCTSAAMVLFDPSDHSNLFDTAVAVTLGGAAGTITRKMAQAAAAAADWSQAAWFLRFTDPAGNLVSLLGGMFALTWVPP